MVGGAEDSIVLHATVSLLARDFRLVGDQLVMPATEFNRWCSQVSAAAPTDRPAIGEGLIALALRLRREAAPASSQAIPQLAQLAALALGADHVAAQLGKDALDLAALPNAKILGGGSRAIPAAAGSPPPSGTINAGTLGARMGQPLGGRRR